MVTALGAGGFAAGIAAAAATPVHLGATAARHSGSPHGLPHVTSGHRPGPDILYAKPAKAPQLENRGVWHARPILVSGAQSYRAGEWVYQDYLYDDHGATGSADSNSPYGPSADLYSPTAGTFTYPTDKAYADNAADLVEFRAKPLARATAFRVTLNTLKRPATSAFTIALGNSASARAWPHGAGVSSPAKYFLTWHGRAAALTNAATGKTLSPAPRVRVSLHRRQVQIVVAHKAWNPKHGKVRATIGVGLWNRSSGSYLAPQPGSATATTPGGGSANGVAIVNVGPRLHEPKPLIAGATMADTGAAGQVAAQFWRERQQSEQLALGDVSPFGATINFAKLAHHTRDDSGVPKVGAMDRIYASHFSFGQGYDPSRVCYDLAAGFAAGAKCVGRMVGQLQPYALYVPAKRRPARGYGMTLLLHSLSANYNQYFGSHNQSQLGDRGPGSIVLTPSDRGPDGFYAGFAEADTFEAWNDVARHYRLDRDWSTVSGYSMGGFGTYRLLARWPDLFAKGFSVVGAPGTVDDQLTSLRNTPLLLWNSTEDELVNLSTSEAAVKADTAAGIRFQEDLFLTADHLTLAGNDQYAPGAAFLGTTRVDRNPTHVTYVVDPTEDSSRGRVVADHAYWLSGLVPRGSGDATIDVRSAGFGTGDAPVLPVKQGTGTLTGGEIPLMAYVSRTQAWGPAPHAAKRDVLTLKATNLRTVTIDVRRAHVDCNVKLTATSDGPSTSYLPAARGPCTSPDPAPHRKVTENPRGVRPGSTSVT